ncbi:MAG: lipid-A-disaccharide synthase [Planctomycetales bacterium]
MRLFFSVGEPSGDQHAAHLIEELRRRDPNVQVSGFGGPKMAAAGADLLFPLTDLAVMGVLAVLPLIQKFRQLARDADQWFETYRPDAVVLIDFPGFNWWIARAAKRRGIKVVYYSPPQIWAWASWRIHKMRRLVDHILCCLPFESDWYKAQSLPAEYVGHPFFDDIAHKPLDRDFLERHQPDAQTRIIGVLPGSRNHEVRHNFPLQIQVMKQLARRHPEARFLVACYKEHQRDFCQKMLERQRVEFPVELSVGKTSEIIEASELCLMVSGSVSLELLARETPAVVLYHVDKVFALCAKLLVTCKWMSLPNLIAGRTLMPEFPLWGRATRGVHGMTDTISRWISDRSLLDYKVAELADLKRQVAIPGATTRAAEAILRHMGVTQATHPQRSRAAA